jgi:hypothetical protein
MHVFFDIFDNYRKIQMSCWNILESIKARCFIILGRYTGERNFVSARSIIVFLGETAICIFEEEELSLC